VKTENGGGRGGGMYLSHGSATLTTPLSSLVFESNNASIGGDLFLECPTLRSLVTKDSFSFASSVENVEKPLWGKDSNKFVEEVDLFVFIDGYKGSTIYVGTGGESKLYY
jgi:hypothetical protein